MRALALIPAPTFVTKGLVAFGDRGDGPKIGTTRSLEERPVGPGEAPPQGPICAPPTLAYRKGPPARESPPQGPGRRSLEERVRPAQTVISCEGEDGPRVPPEPAPTICSTRRLEGEQLQDFPLLVGKVHAPPYLGERNVGPLYVP